MSVNPSAKLKLLKAARLLIQGHVLAQQTSTLSGVTASPYSTHGICKIQQFKQRKGPFLLLADSVSTALKQASYLTPSLRKLAKQSWPGAVTLVFPARKFLAAACYQQGLVAIRVDQNIETCRLALASGGLLLSSSLNRKGQAVESPSKRLQFRWKRHLSGILTSERPHLGQASSMIRIRGRQVTKLR